MLPEKELTGSLEAIATASGFFAAGAIIGIGQLFLSGQPLTPRLILGRAISIGGLSMSAGAVLVWVPSLPLLGQIGIAAGLASLGISGLEKLFTRAVGKMFVEKGKEHE